MKVLRLIPLACRTCHQSPTITKTLKDYSIGCAGEKCNIQTVIDQSVISIITLWNLYNGRMTGEIDISEEK